MATDYEKMTDKELLELAQHYLNGTGDFDQDPEEGVRIIKYTAERGNADALCDYGTCLFNGSGIAKDDAAALEYWTQAAEQGSASAMHKVGMCYLRGLCGLEKDPRKSADLFTQASEKGEANAIFNLAVMYENGIGVDKNPAKSNELLLIAAEKKLPIACFFLGMKTMAEAGSNAEATAKAVSLIQLAAEAGEARAQFVYGSLFQSGRGVEKDLAQAAGWYRRSAKGGFAPANQALQQLGFPGIQ